MKKLTVTCTCGQEVSVPKDIAGRVMSQGRTYDKEHLKAISKKGVEARMKIKNYKDNKKATVHENSEKFLRRFSKNNGEK